MKKGGPGRNNDNPSVYISRAHVTSALFSCFSETNKSLPQAPTRYLAFFSTRTLVPKNNCYNHCTSNVTRMRTVNTSALERPRLIDRTSHCSVSCASQTDRDCTRLSHHLSSFITQYSVRLGIQRPEIGTQVLQSTSAHSATARLRLGWPCGMHTIKGKPS